MGVSKVDERRPPAIDPRSVWRYRFVQGMTASRLLWAAVFALVFLRATPGPGRLASCLTLWALIELSDLLDGWLARRWNVVSSWGERFDPLADSLARFTVYWALAVGGAAWSIVPWVMAVRDILVAYARMAWVAEGRSAKARPSGKVKAWVQGVGALALILSDAGRIEVSARTISWIVAGATALSAWEYLRDAFSGHQEPLQE